MRARSSLATDRFVGFFPLLLLDYNNDSSEPSARCVHAATCKQYCLHAVRASAEGEGKCATNVITSCYTLYKYKSRVANQASEPASAVLR